MNTDVRRVDDDLRFLRRVRIVEVDQRLVMHAPRQQRKVGAVAQRIEGLAHAVTWGSRALSNAST